MEIADIFVLNKSDRDGADRLEQQLRSMLSLVMPRDGWHPAIVRTVASEDKGIVELGETVAKFRKHFESSGDRQKKHIEHWEKRLTELIEWRLLEQVLNGKAGEAKLRALATEVALRKIDPFTAVTELLEESGLKK
jgi:LAO/AO transport system kinase